MLYLISSPLGPDAIPYPLPIDEITHMGDADWETQRKFLANKQKEWDVGTKA